MNQYRLYLMNPASGHIDRCEQFDAADDAEAIRTVEPVVGLQPLELWCGHRKVIRLEVNGERVTVQSPAIA